MDDGSREGVPTGIGRLNESSLHADVKAWYARPGDRLEAEVDGCVVDIVRGPLLVEVQTGSFSSIRDKLARLVASHPVCLVYPLAVRTWIVRVSPEGETLGRRRSPRRGTFLDLFDELVYVADLLREERLGLEVLSVHQEEVRCPDGRGSRRRRGMSLLDRRLLEVVGSRRFDTAGDLVGLLPEGLPAAFTNRDLAEAAGVPVYRARRISYTLRRLGALDLVGRRRNAHVYALRP